MDVLFLYIFVTREFNSAFMISAIKYKSSKPGYDNIFMENANKVFTFNSAIRVPQYIIAADLIALKSAIKV